MSQSLVADQVRIVIPTYQRADKLRACLEALAAQSGGPYPTIVVDDGGDANTKRVCEDFAHWVHYIQQANSGPGIARNTGISHAPEGSYICLIDDDCIASPQWVKELVRAQGGVPMKMVGGAIRNGLPRNPFSSASQAICSYMADFYDAHESDMRFFSTNNMCFRVEDFRKVGEFGTDYPYASEDRELCLRWSALGGTFQYAPAASINHAHALSLHSFWKQQQNYGRGTYYLHKGMNRRGDDRRKFEAVGFYATLLSYPLKKPGHYRIFQSFLIGIAHVALLFGYIGAQRSERRSNG